MKKLRLGLCKSFVKLSKGADALRECGAFLELEEGSLEGLVQRAEARLLVEDFEGAVADYKAAVQKNPQDHGLRQALMNAEQKLKISKRKDYYKILGLSKVASAVDIKKAYKRLAIQYHPGEVTRPKQNRVKCPSFSLVWFSAFGVESIQLRLSTRVVLFFVVVALEIRLITNPNLV